MKIKEFNCILKFLLPKNIIGITLCPFGIYVKNLKTLTQRTINHEKIHWKQQLEMLIILFYICYVLEYIIRYFLLSNNPYRRLSFEQEAYNNDYNMNYLKNRKPYSWLKYLFKK